MDWAYRIDPLRCVSMHGVTERYISAQKNDAAGYVRILLDEMESRISTNFARVSSLTLLYRFSLPETELNLNLIRLIVY